ncbi:hypothetical protein [Kitasatospora sp. NRRL B-11411]|uniref:hypothetical protein n=1 Tax=Kitasatospora sp. NRRL B-11411 TaxID=1463822 RepID=UPI001E5780D2|nr:hypothetical protein [Kitasatospora sp. NRRL B-11411]
MSTLTVSFSDLSKNSKRVADTVEQAQRVHVTRRDGEDLYLTTERHDRQREPAPGDRRVAGNRENPGGPRTERPAHRTAMGRPLCGSAGEHPTLLRSPPHRPPVRE